LYKENGGTISLIVMMSICLTTSVCLEFTVQEVTLTMCLLLLKQEPLKEEPLKEEPLKEEPLKEEPLKEKPLKEEPLKEEPLISRTSCFSDL